MKKYFLFLCCLLSLFSNKRVCAQKLTENIKLNQVGFYTNAPKQAIVTGGSAEKYFYITSTNLRDTFFTGTLGTINKSAYSTTVTQLADFSTFQKKGNYVLLINKLGHSYIFSINDDLLKNTLNASLKAFYYQRASMPLEEKFAGKWARGTGHPDNKVYVHPSAASKERPAGFVIASPGGWYDAGDYNKYIVNSGITMGTLLSAYEDFPEASSLVNPTIPHSKGVPAIIEESVYNLRWMLTMQDPNDGGIYTKCTNAVFDSMILPGITTAPRYVVQKSTAAALNFVAVTAQAGRILKKFQQAFPGLADSCVAASLKAWQWALVNKNVAYHQEANNKMYTPAITTGGYGDSHFEDEWFWAAAEMYCSNPKIEYLKIIEENQKEVIMQVPSWNQVAMLGYYTLLRKQKNISFLLNVETINKNVLAIADTFVQKMNVNAFKTIMGQSAKDFIWGSNSVAANQGILLINAYLISKNKKYLDAALTNVDYILGRNATGYSFITGIGSKTPMHPHHRPSIADGVIEPVPGLLAGGPNPGRQDGCVYEFTETETAYTDVDCSYASNEIAINWNAPLVYLLNAMNALKKEAGYVKK